MVRELELRAWVRVWSRAVASAWPRLEQVHLVRLDIQRQRLSLQPDAATREVTVDDIFGAYESPERKHGAEVTGMRRIRITRVLMR